VSLKDTRKLKMPYDIIGANEGADFVSGSGGGRSSRNQVDQILGALDIIGEERHERRMGRGRHHRGAYHGGEVAVDDVSADLAAALANKRAQAGLIVQEQQPGATRRLVLGMASTGAIAAGFVVSITARPQNLAFKPQRIVIPATIAPDFLITDIKVGNVSQVVQASTLPAEAFTQQLFDGQMEMDTVQTSQDFVLQVQNIAGAPRNFNAAVYGLALLAR
jgi:hypothetical protein